MTPPVDKDLIDVPSTPTTVDVSTLMQVYTPAPQTAVASDAPPLVPPVNKATDVVDYMTSPLAPTRDALPIPTKSSKRKFSYIKRSSFNVRSY